MVILGLGSNLGDRLQHLRDALQKIQQIPSISIQKVSPVYLSDALLPENAEGIEDIPYLNAAIRCETALSPEGLLIELKKIEKNIGRDSMVKRWGPRVIDIDILAWDDKVIQNEKLTIPHEQLCQRPFAFWPLADIAPDWKFPLVSDFFQQPAALLVERWGSRFSGDAPLHTRQINQRIDTPQIVGIINLTPDSFSDGGKIFSHEQAIHQAIHLIEAGADVLDIGAESTAPQAKMLSPEQEWQRLENILATLTQMKDKFLLSPKISVDTRHAKTAEQALSFNIDWINDVSGIENKDMQAVIAQANIDCVMMHHVSIPADRNKTIPAQDDPVTVVMEWAKNQISTLEKNHISPNRVIFDPGIGFGKIPAHSLLLLQHIEVFKSLGVRILIGHSRKSFLSLFTPHQPMDRDIETLAISLNLINKPIDYLRVHHVEMLAKAMKVARVMDFHNKPTQCEMNQI